MHTTIEQFWEIYNKEAKAAGMKLGAYPMYPKLIRISDGLDPDNNICPVCFVAQKIDPSFKDGLTVGKAACHIGLDFEFAYEVAKSADFPYTKYREQLLAPLK